MAIIYLHGFASSVKTHSKKYDALSEIAKVHPCAPDYTKGFELVMAHCLAFASTLDNVSAVVGTSMGGYTASHLASRLKVPFVAINPSITPSESLQKYIGTHQSYSGDTFVLRMEEVASYPAYNASASGLIIVSNFDEVVPPQITKDLAEKHQLPLISCDYGDHLFEDISALIKPIAEHLAKQREA
ncbi:MAG TPA: YqiA/YcfP family alpha/beta fold hydrolase [Alcanivoracaceae bacterium]|nr:YqiA/YcfP family alpha/beta fold hydrolase [Alcanivoracaceae bacterium]